MQNICTVLAPFYTLLKKKPPWRWQTDQEKAFIEAKAFLKSPKLLVHYDECEEFDPNKLRLTSGTGSSTGTLHGRWTERMLHEVWHRQSPSMHTSIKKHSPSCVWLSNILWQKVRHLFWPLPSHVFLCWAPSNFSNSLCSSGAMGLDLEWLSVLNSLQKQIGYLY